MTERRTDLDGRDDPARDGDDQREWLVDTITGSETTGRSGPTRHFTVPLRVGSGPLSRYPAQGGWDGYTRECRRITEAVAAGDVENYVTLTGDMHCYVAAHQQDSCPGRVSGGEKWEGGGPGRAHRRGVHDARGHLAERRRGAPPHPRPPPSTHRTATLVARPGDEPHVEFFDSHHWGYSVVEFTPEDCAYVGYAVDETVDSADAEREVVVAYRDPGGERELGEVTGEYRS